MFKVEYLWKSLVKKDGVSANFSYFHLILPHASVLILNCNFENGKT